MYRNCIFCSGDLGANESIESFPVGRSLAFDGERGRLWAVCPRCGRWNLAPIEERWEAVEEAEKRFADTRLRVQRENIGLAKLPDGSRLVRVGQALTGELAAWRYGDQLVRRRRGYLLAGAAAVAGGVAVVGGLMAVTAGATVFSMWGGVSGLIEQMRRRKVIHRVVRPDGGTLPIRRWHLEGSWLGADEERRLLLNVPDVTRKDPQSDGWGTVKYTGTVLTLADADARLALNRAMVHVNRKGASRDRVANAVGLLTSVPSADEFILQAARSGRVLGKRKDMVTRALTVDGALALEMALHEEQERRALEGELAVLESAWREAEEIAAIADVLPDDPLQRFARRLGA